MTSHDIFQSLNDQPAALLDTVIERMEFRGRDPGFSAMLEAYLDRLGLDNASEVLDHGCGTGVAARAVARRAGFHCRVLGVDPSAPMIEAARRLAAEAGLEDRLSFEVGDGHKLAAADASFDAVVAHTTISHVTDPAAVLREVARVLRPGGVLGLFDGDYASLVLSHPDPALESRLIEAIRQGMVANPTVLRRLPAMLRESGFAIQECLPFVLADVGRGSFFPNFAETFGPMVANHGLVPARNVERWLADQRRAALDGTFFGSCNYYAYIARLTA
jgi:SAM-dependent methyltransferase